MVRAGAGDLLAFEVLERLDLRPRRDDRAPVVEQVEQVLHLDAANVAERDRLQRRAAADLELAGVELRRIGIRRALMERDVEPVRLVEFLRLDDGRHEGAERGRAEDEDVELLQRLRARIGKRAEDERGAARTSPGNLRRDGIAILPWFIVPIRNSLAASPPLIDATWSLEPGRGDDLHRLLVADRERHVRAHHKAVRPEHRDDELQHPRVMQDAVEIELGERFDRIGHARRDLLIALEPSDQEGKAGGAHGNDDPGVAVAHDVAAVDEPPHGDHGIADAADRIRQAIVVHPHVAGIETRMDVDGGAGLVRRPPERIEVAGRRGRCRCRAAASRSWRPESPPPSPH